MRVVIAIWVVLVRSALSANCPHYCECHLQHGYQYVGCVNKGLTSIDLDVPTSVQWLKLTDNSITSLGFLVFSSLNLEQIEILELNRNKISVINSYAFDRMNVLQSVDLSNNHLTRLSIDTFLLHPKLITLHLSFNPLQSLSSPFLISISIEYLYLKNISLGFLPMSAFVNMPSLKLLDLTDNQLISFLAPHVVSLPNYVQVNLSGNYIDCNEYSLLTNELKRKSISIYDVNCPSELNQKIITVETNYSSVFRRTFHSIFISSKEVKDLYKTTSKPPPTEEPYTFSISTVETTTLSNLTKSINNNSNLIIAIIFITGLSLGAFIAYATVGLYKLHRRCRRRHIQPNIRRPSDNVELPIIVPRTSRDPLSRNTIMCPESTSDPTTPPPDYNELYGGCKGTSNY